MGLFSSFFEGGKETGKNGEPRESLAFDVQTVLIDNPAGISLEGALKALKDRSPDKELDPREIEEALRAVGEQRKDGRWFLRGETKKTGNMVQ